MNRRRLQTVLRGRQASDPLLRQLTSVAVASGSSLAVVGGYVRDAALGRKSRDLDLVCHARAAAVTRLLRETWKTRGFRFRKRGVTTWRFDSAGRQVDLVDATRRGLERDLARRELTINAIAFDLASGRVLDPLGGLADLRLLRLRAPRPGIMAEDPVRALRLARFVAELPGARPSPGLLREAASVARALRRASVERLRDELNRLFQARDAAPGLDLLERLALTDSILPELAPARGCAAGAGRPDVWRHTLEAIALSTPGRRIPGAAVLRDPERRRVLRWALLLHDVAKPDTLARAADGRPTFHGHETLGAARSDRILRRLRVPRAERRRVVALVRNHLRPGHLADSGASPRGMRRLVRDAGDDLPLLVAHAACDARASGSPDATGRWRRLRAVLLALLELPAEMRRRAPRPLLDGRDVMHVLGLEPGPEIGRILEALRDEQESGRVANRGQALSWLRRQGV